MPVTAAKSKREVITINDGLKKSGKYSVDTIFLFTLLYSFLLFYFLLYIFSILSATGFGSREVRP